MLTKWLSPDKIESGKKNREGTAPDFLGSFLSGDLLGRASNNNSFACEGSNINRAKSCPTNGGNLKSSYLEKDKRRHGCQSKIF
jgi:hypothetical protein